MTTTKQAKMTTLKKLGKERNTVPYTPTQSIIEAAGLLKDRYADLKKHYQKIRKEWPSYHK